MKARVKDIVHQNGVIQQQIAAQIREAEALTRSYNTQGNPVIGNSQIPIINNPRTNTSLDRSMAQGLAQADVTSFLQPPTRRRPERGGEGGEQQGPPLNQQTSFDQHQDRQRSHSMMAERAQIPLNRTGVPVEAPSELYHAHFPNLPRPSRPNSRRGTLNGAPCPPLVQQTSFAQHPSQQRDHSVTVERAQIPLSRTEGPLGAPTRQYNDHHPNLPQPS